VRIRFGCGLDSRIYGISNWNKETPPVTFCPQIVDSSGIEVGLAPQGAGVYTRGSAHSLMTAPLVMRIALAVSVEQAV
jgi:hypothetical protein